MTVTTHPNLTAGNYSEKIRLKTNVEQMPTMDFSVLAVVLGDLKVNRSTVSLGTARAGQPLNYTVVLTPTSDPVVFKVTGAEIDIPDLSVEVKEIRPNEETRVHIKGTALPADHPASRNRDRIRGTLRIFTNLESQREIQVLVFYMLKK